MSTIHIVQTILLWHEASDPPDADIEVLLAHDGEACFGYWDDERQAYCNTYGLYVDATHWAHCGVPS